MSVTDPCAGTTTVEGEALNASSPLTDTASVWAAPVRLVSVRVLLSALPLPDGTAPNEVLTEESATLAVTAASTSSSPAPMTTGSVSARSSTL